MRNTLLVIALAIIVPVGIVKGRWTGRWTPSETFNFRLAAIGRIPLNIGDWTGRDINPEARTYERSGVVGGRMIRYENASGEAISVMIVCGRPGPTSVHTPEACYAGAGYEPASARVPISVSDEQEGADELWASDFLKEDTATPEYLRIFHGWSIGGPWRASVNPRRDFAGSDSLYKIYVVRPMSRVAAGPSSDPAIAFMRRLFPEMRKALWPAS